MALLRPLVAAALCACLVAAASLPCPPAGPERSAAAADATEVAVLEAPCHCGCCDQPRLAAASGALAPVLLTTAWTPLAAAHPPIPDGVAPALAPAPTLARDPVPI